MGIFLLVGCLKDKTLGTKSLVEYKYEVLSDSLPVYIRFQIDNNTSYFLNDTIAETNQWEYKWVKYLYVEDTINYIPVGGQTKWLHLSAYCTSDLESKVTVNLYRNNRLVISDTTQLIPKISGHF